MAISAPKVYLTGHAKRNVDTGELAVRTIFPEDQGPQLAAMAWLVATPNVGARNAKTEEVAAWEDLYTPQPAPTPSEPTGETGS